MDWRYVIHKNFSPLDIFRKPLRTHELQQSFLVSNYVEGNSPFRSRKHVLLTIQSETKFHELK